MDGLYAELFVMFIAAVVAIVCALTLIELL